MLHRVHAESTSQGARCSGVVSLSDDLFPWVRAIGSTCRRRGWLLGGRLLRPDSGEAAPVGGVDGQGDALGGAGEVLEEGIAGLAIDLEAGTPTSPPSMSRFQEDHAGNGTIPFPAPPWAREGAFGLTRARSGWIR